MAQIIQRTRPRRTPSETVPGSGLLSLVSAMCCLLQSIRLLHQPVSESLGHIQSLVFFQPMLGDQPREETAIHAPCHIVARRNREKGSRVVVETYGIVEAGRLGHL